MKKIIVNKFLLVLLGIVLLSLIPLITAEVQTLGYFEVGEEIELKQIGDDYTSCNITSVSYPNSTTIVSDVVMTKRGDEYNYTLSSSYTDVIGKYVVNGICDNDVWAYDFYVTPSGSDDINAGEGISLSLAIFSILAIGILFFIFSFKINFIPMKIFLMGSAIILFIVVVGFTMVTFSELLGGYDKLVNTYSSFYWLVLFSSLVVTIFLLLVVLRNAVELFFKWKGLR